MKFELRHSFSCTPAELWAVTDSAEFEERLARATDARRELVTEEVQGATRYVRRRISTRRELPAAMQRVLGTNEISYDQETWRPLDGDRLRWRIAPRVLSDRFSGEGTTTVRVTAAGCERVVVGELIVKVPLVGGAMEKRLVDDVSASYERAAIIIRELLARR